MRAKGLSAVQYYLRSCLSKTPLLAEFLFFVSLSFISSSFLVTPFLSLFSRFSCSFLESLSLSSLSRYTVTSNQALSFPNCPIKVLKKDNKECQAFSQR